MVALGLDLPGHRMRQRLLGEVPDHRHEQVHAHGGGGDDECYEQEKDQAAGQGGPAYCGAVASATASPAASILAGSEAQCASASVGVSRR